MSGNKVGLLDMPNEVLTHIVTFLPSLDFVRFTLTSKRVFHLFNQNHVEWKRFLHQELGEPCKSLQTMVEKLLISGTALTLNHWKLLFLMQKKTLMNWSSNNYRSFRCSLRGDNLAFDMSANFLGTFAYLKKMGGKKQLIIHRFDEIKFEWREERITMAGKLLKNATLTKVEDLTCHNQKAIVRISTSISSNRVLVCYDLLASETVWCGVARYVPRINPEDTDIVTFQSNSYVIVCQRNACIQVLMFNTNTGCMIYDFRLTGYRLGPFHEYCSPRSCLAFAITPVNDINPEIFTLDLNGRLGIRQLELLGDPLIENKPLTVLSSEILLYESSTISVWCLETCACKYYIFLKNYYCFMTTLSFESKTKVDMTVGAWLDPHPGGHAFHILKVKETEATVVYSMDPGIIEPAGSKFSYIGQLPILLSKSNVKSQEETEENIFLMIGQKDFKYAPQYWTAASDLNSIKFMSESHVGIQADGSIEFLDYLQLDRYILKSCDDK